MDIKKILFKTNTIEIDFRSKLDNDITIRNLLKTVAFLRLLWYNFLDKVVNKTADTACLQDEYEAVTKKLMDFTKSLKNSFIRLNRKSIKNRPTYLTKNLKRLDDNQWKN